MHTPALLVTAVKAEYDAVMEGLHGDRRFDVAIAGVGAVAAATCTARHLAKKSYKSVVSLGIAGGFSTVQRGDVCVGTQAIMADFGVEFPDGHVSDMATMGYGRCVIASDARLCETTTHVLGSIFCVHTGPILTVHVVTGTESTALQRTRRYPSVIAEAMEGYGVGSASQTAQFIEVRVISNAVGVRDTTQWRIPEALDTLRQVISACKEGW